MINTITNKEQSILTFIISKSLFFCFGFSYIIQNSLEYSPLSIFLGYILTMIIIYFITNKTQTNNIITKIFFTIISITLSIISIISFTNQINNHYLLETPKLIIIIPLITLSLFIAFKNLNTLAKTASILLPITLFFLIISLLGNIPNLDISNLIPINNININFIKTTLYTTILSLLPTLILIKIIPKSNQKSLFIGLSLSCLTIILIVITILSTLGITLSTIFNYPEYITLKKIHFPNILERIENFISLTSLLDITTLLSTIFIYLKRVMTNSYLF